MKRIILILGLILPTAAVAQSWPIYENTGVNDYAGVIEDEAKIRINRTLQTLKEETGVEATVLTLFTRIGYEETENIEQFATGLFNHWGVGDANRNDGILILVVTQAREMRIELGSGYPKDFDREARDIIQDAFLPAFKDDRMGEGIEEGTDQVLTHIARAYAAGENPRATGSGGGIPMGKILGGGFFAVVLAIIFGPKIIRSRRKCPQCGAGGLNKLSETIDKASKTADGQGQETLSCSKCNYRNIRNYSIAYTATSSSASSSSGGGSFGGGSSSGGGSSGSW